MDAATGPRDRPATSMSPRSGGQRAVAIIGAGWAGLACGVALVQAGCKVTVFEAAKVPGGRARSVAGGDALGTLDNGQHVLIGPYRETFALMARIGVDRRRVLRRLPLAVHGTDGLRLHVPAWPLGLGGLVGVLGARGLGLGGRRALLRVARGVPALVSAPQGAAPDCSVADWLHALQQPPELVRRLWAPLCVAALNTPAERASAQVFARVLHDGLLAAGAAASIEVPSRPLGELLPEPAVAWLHGQGAEVRLGCRVTGLTRSVETDVATDTGTPDGASTALGTGAADGALGVVAVAVPRDDESAETTHAKWTLHTTGGKAGPFDAVVVAVAPHQAAGLLAGHANDATLRLLGDLEYEAIATVHLRFATPLPSNAGMLTLLQPDTPQSSGEPPTANTPHGAPGEWLVDHGDGRASVVISAWRRTTLPHTPARSDGASGDSLCSDPADAEQATADPLAAEVEAQLRRLIPGLPAVTASKTLIEKRATFACTPGLQRPGHDTGAPGLWLAGDYTAGPYPATLEGAVRSGIECARQLVVTLPTYPLQIQP